ERAVRFFGDPDIHEAVSGQSSGRGSRRSGVGGGRYFGPLRFEQFHICADVNQEIHPFVWESSNGASGSIARFTRVTNCLNCTFERRRGKRSSSSFLGST